MYLGADDAPFAAVVKENEVLCTHATPEDLNVLRVAIQSGGTRFHQAEVTVPTSSVLLERLLGR